MDSKYLKETVGKPLAEGLAAVALEQPEDPVEYLGHWLLKHLSRARVEAQLATAVAQAESAKAAAAAKKEAEEKAELSVAEAKGAEIDIIRSSAKVTHMYANLIGVLRKNTNATNVYVSLFEKPPPKFDEEGNEIPVEEEPEEEPPEEPEEEPVPDEEEPAEGEEVEPELDEEGNPIPKPPKVVKPKPLPKISKTNHLRVIAANEDNRFMIGKFFPRKLTPNTFAAVDCRGMKLIPNVFDTEAPIHFFDMPLPGSYAAHAFIDEDKYIVGCVHLDTLGADERLGPEDGQFLENSVQALFEVYDRLVTQVRIRRAKETELCISLHTSVQPTEEEALAEEDTVEIIDDKIGVGITTRMAAVITALDDNLDSKILGDCIRPDTEEGPPPVHAAKFVGAAIALVRGTKEAPLHDVGLETSLEICCQHIGVEGEFLAALKAFDVKADRVKKSFQAARRFIGELTVVEAAEAGLVPGLLLVWCNLVLELSDKALEMKKKEVGPEDPENPLDYPILELDQEDDDERARLIREKEEAEQRAIEEAAEAARKEEEERIAAEEAAAAAEAAEAAGEGGEEAAEEAAE